VPSLGTGEVFAFGEAVAVPTRLSFRELPAEVLPKSEAVSSADTDFGRNVDQNFIDAVVDRWRSATLSNRVRLESSPDGGGAPSAAATPAEQRRLDPDRYRLIKKTAKPGQPAR
jgi:hypothetical protein